MTIKSDVDPISRKKVVDPVVAEFFFVDLFVGLPGAASVAFALEARRAIRAEPGLPLLKRKIWCSAYHPSSVSGGCAMIGVVIS